MYGAMYMGQRIGWVWIDEFIWSIRKVCVTQERWDKLLKILEEKKKP